MVALDRIHDNIRLLKLHSSPYHSEHARCLKKHKKTARTSPLKCTVLLFYLSERTLIIFDDPQMYVLFSLLFLFYV